MLQILHSDERGRSRISWLDSAHSFSFGGYHNPQRMGFRGLRVLNDDRVAAGGGFQPHSHRDMEIVSYVVSGTLEHKDSLGTGSRIVPGDVQRMSAGRGITHSEFNGSRTEGVRFLQIWFPPARQGDAPSYEQKYFAPESRKGQLRLVLSPDGAQDSVTVHQDVRLYAALLDADQAVTHAIPAGRAAWVQIVRGRAKLGDEILAEGDAVAVVEQADLTLTGVEDCELLVFDLA